MPTPRNSQAASANRRVTENDLTQIDQPQPSPKILAEQRPVFVVEFHRDVGWPVIGHLVAAGYRFEKFDGTRIDTPADPDAVPSYFVAVPR